jgi:hypothetical protein
MLDMEIRVGEGLLPSVFHMLTCCLYCIGLFDTDLLRLLSKDGRVPIESNPLSFVAFGTERFVFFLMSITMLSSNTCISTDSTWPCRQSASIVAD